MLAVLDGYWIRVAVVVAVALASWLIRAAARAGHYPRLPEPEPGTAPTRADRLRYYGSVVLALGVGLVAGGLLWLVPPRQDADDLFRFAVFDQPAARLLAPLFVTLSVAALVSYRIAAGLIAPGQGIRQPSWREAECAAANTAGTKYAATRSASRWIGARLRCAWPTS